MRQQRISISHRTAWDRCCRGRGKRAIRVSPPNPNQSMVACPLHRSIQRLPDMRGNRPIASNVVQQLSYRIQLESYKIFMQSSMHSYCVVPLRMLCENYSVCVGIFFALFRTSVASPGSFFGLRWNNKCYFGLTVSVVLNPFSSLQVQGRRKSIFDSFSVFDFDSSCASNVVAYRICSVFGCYDFLDWEAGF